MSKSIYQETADSLSLQFSLGELASGMNPADAADVPPWTEIEAGRFMPRRVRGSGIGRALG